MKNFGRYDRQAGVTLIELMIVIVIIAIIASAAYPLYTQYVVRAKRSVGATMLLQVADRQQQYFMDHKRYASSLESLGFTSNPFMMNDQGALVAESLVYSTLQAGPEFAEWRSANSPRERTRESGAGPAADITEVARPVPETPFFVR